MWDMPSAAHAISYQHLLVVPPKKLADWPYVNRAKEN
jgi:hypothetical protein